MSHILSILYSHEDNVAFLQKLHKAFKGVATVFLAIFFDNLSYEGARCVIRKEFRGPLSVNPLEIFECHSCFRNFPAYFPRLEWNKFTAHLDFDSVLIANLDLAILSHLASENVLPNNANPFYRFQLYQKCFPTYTP